jgi:hypothetical protein
MRVGKKREGVGALDAEGEQNVQFHGTAQKLWTRMMSIQRTGEFTEGSRSGGPGPGSGGQSAESRTWDRF